jgi:hypothetical protein
MLLLPNSWGMVRAKKRLMSGGQTGLHVPGQVPLRAVVGREAEAGRASRVQPQILHAADHVAGAADTGADKGREAPPGAEIDIGVGKEHRRRDVALHDVETVAAAGAELGEAAGRSI